MKYLSFIISFGSAAEPLQRALSEQLYGVTRRAEAASMWLAKQADLTLLGISQNTRDYEMWMLNMALKLYDEVDIDLFDMVPDLIPESPERQEAFRQLVHAFHAYGVQFRVKRVTVGSCSTDAELIHRTINEKSTEELVVFGNGLATVTAEMDRLSVAYGMDVKYSFAPSGLASFYCSRFAESDDRIDNIRRIVARIEPMDDLLTTIEWGIRLGQVMFSGNQDSVRIIQLANIAKNLPLVLLQLGLENDRAAEEVLRNTQTVLSFISHQDSKLFESNEVSKRDLLRALWYRAEHVVREVTRSRDPEWLRKALAHTEEKIQALIRLGARYSNAPVINGPTGIVTTSGTSVRITSALFAVPSTVQDQIRDVLPRLTRSKQEWLDTTLNGMIMAGDRFSDVQIGCLMVRHIGLPFLSRMSVKKEIRTVCSNLIHGPIVSDEEFLTLMGRDIPSSHRTRAIVLAYKEYQSRSPGFGHADVAAGFLPRTIFSWGMNLKIMDHYFNLSGSLASRRYLHILPLGVRDEVATLADPVYRLSYLSAKFDRIYRERAVDIVNMERDFAARSTLITVIPGILRGTFRLTVTAGLMRHAPEPMRGMLWDLACAIDRLLHVVSLPRGTVRSEHLDFHQLLQDIHPVAKDLQDRISAASIDLGSVLLDPDQQLGSVDLIYKKKSEALQFRSGIASNIAKIDKVMEIYGISLSPLEY